jgi:hypothetical protein
VSTHLLLSNKKLGSGQGRLPNCFYVKTGE